MRATPATDIASDHAPTGCGFASSNSYISESPLNRSERSEASLVLSAAVANNSDRFADVLRLHVKRGALVADVTFGKGVFWRKIPEGEKKLSHRGTEPNNNPRRSPRRLQRVVRRSEQRQTKKMNIEDIATQYAVEAVNESDIEASWLGLIKTKIKSACLDTMTEAANVCQRHANCFKKSQDGFGGCWTVLASEECRDLILAERAAVTPNAPHELPARTTKDDE